MGHLKGYSLGDSTQVMNVKGASATALRGGVSSVPVGVLCGLWQSRGRSLALVLAF